MRAMILAAGRGERLRPLTDGTPKALIEVAGKPLLQWHLENLARAGFREITINLAHLGDQIQAFAGNGERWGMNIHYSSEEHALETGGGIFQALPLLGTSPFLVINADIWTDFPLYKLRNHHCSHAHLVLANTPPHHTDGDFFLKHGLVMADEGISTGQKLTFSGLGIYNPALFAGSEAGRFSLVPLLKAAMADSKVTGEAYRGHWYDSGTEDRLAALREAIATTAG